MENMDKGLTVPKWVLINRLKMPQMPQNLSIQIVCISPNVWDFNEKRLHWASIVRDVKVTTEVQEGIVFLSNVNVLEETKIGLYKFKILFDVI